MKLLGWMHRKFRQNSEPLKDSPIGRPSLDDLHYFQKPSNCTKSLSKGQRDSYFRKSFASLEAARVEEEDLEEESSDTCSELFHGFLAIGTFGTEPVTVDPSSTPTFYISVETIAEKETEVTENELKVINDELEKVLGAESKDDGCNLSSGRNSHVSAGRSSHCSTITLGGKPIESAENNVYETITCPLQDYLFGSAIEMAETTPVAKKENRTSLGELFQKTKLAEENGGAKCDRGEKRAEKEADKSAVNLMKKMLKKKTPHASSRNSTSVTGGNTTDSTSAETKMQKILQKFQRKIHPESSTTEGKSDKTNKNEIKSNVTYKGASNKGGGDVSTGEDIIIFPKRSFSKGSIRGINSQSNPTQFTISGGDSNGNRECWIKTDADYLVLEL